MTETKVCAYTALVYFYQKSTSQWEKQGEARVCIFESDATKRSRVVARALDNPNKVLVNTYIFKELVLREDGKIFLQWADRRTLYGIKFHQPSHSSDFSSFIKSAIQKCSSGDSTQSRQPLVIEVEENYEPVAEAIEIMINDYNQFFGEYDQTYDLLTHVPVALSRAIEFLEQNLDVEYLMGIKLDYNQLQAAEEMKNVEEPQYTADSDVDLVAELVKSKYRDYKPLISFENYEPLTSYNELGDDYDKKAQFMLNLIQSLPDRNRQLLQVLIWLLANIGYNAHVNKMTTSSLAALFCSSLMTPQVLDYKKPAKTKMTQKLVF